MTTQEDPVKITRHIYLAQARQMEPTGPASTGPGYDVRTLQRVALSGGSDDTVEVTKVTLTAADGETGVVYLLEEQVGPALERLAQHGPRGPRAIALEH